MQIPKLFLCPFLYLFQHWNNIIESKSKDKNECCLFVQNDLIRMVLDVSGECLFGYEFNTIAAGDTKISNAFKDMFDGITAGANTITRKLYSWIPFLKLFMKSTTTREESFKIISQVIKQVRT